MKLEIPNILTSAINNGLWQAIASDRMRLLLGSDLPEMRLFADRKEMDTVAKQLDIAGYVEDPQFCMVRSRIGLARPDDPRLIFNCALFVAGSKVPGDDVFVAMNLSDSEADPILLVFDWTMPMPSRWTARSRLSKFIEGLKVQ